MNSKITITFNNPAQAGDILQIQEKYQLIVKYVMQMSIMLLNEQSEIQYKKEL